MPLCVYYFCILLNRKLMKSDALCRGGFLLQEQSVLVSNSLTEEFNAVSDHKL